MRLLAAILAVVFLDAEIHAAPRAPAKPAQKQEEKPAAKTGADTSAYDEREALAKLQAMDIFPEMEKEDSEFADAVSTEVECLECEEPDFFKSPAWPLRVARKVAARTGVKPRTVAEIRAHVAKAFEVDDDAFQQIHGIQILSARLTVAGEVLDVTPQFAARVSEQGFTADCDWSLVATLAEESQFERNTDESEADYWKRQRKLLAAVASPVRGGVAMQISFEFHSEQFTAQAKEGERLAISEEGAVSASKIAPAARVVGKAVEAAPAAKPPKKPAGKSEPARR